MSSSTLQLLRRLLDVAQQSRPAVARRADLSLSELVALELLAQQAQGPSDLAKHLGVTSPAASGIVDRLVTRGHAHRTPHDTDRRRTQVELTDSGRAEVVAQLMPMFTSLADLDRGMTDHDRDVVDRYLEGAIQAIRRVL